MAFYGERTMAVTYRRARAHWQSVFKGLNTLRGGLAEFGPDRKGSIALKVALIFAGPMILIDTAVAFFG